jgi:hypothetical protein
MTFMVVNVILLSSLSFSFELGINQSFFSRIDGWPPEADRGLFFKLTSDVSTRAPKMKGQSLEACCTYRFCPENICLSEFRSLRNNHSYEISFYGLRFAKI